MVCGDMRSFPLISIRNRCVSLVKHTSRIYATHSFRIYVACVAVALARCARHRRSLAPPRPGGGAVAEQRAGEVSFGVRTPRGLRGVAVHRAVPSASVVKAMLLVAYLRQPEVHSRLLRRDERALLSPMIRRSDNARASHVCNIVGTSGLARLAGRVRMRHFHATRPWGLSSINVLDQRCGPDPLLPAYRPLRASPPALFRDEAARLDRAFAAVGGSHGCGRAAGRSTSRAAGDPAPAGPTTRWRCCAAAGGE